MQINLQQKARYKNGLKNNFKERIKIRDRA
jgi:hypothetical protein